MQHVFMALHLISILAIIFGIILTWNMFKKNTRKEEKTHVKDLKILENYIITSTNKTTNMIHELIDAVDNISKSFSTISISKIELLIASIAMMHLYVSDNIEDPIKNKQLKDRLRDMEEILLKLEESSINEQYSAYFDSIWLSLRNIRDHINSQMPENVDINSYILDKLDQIEVNLTKVDMSNKYARKTRLEPSTTIEE